MSVDTPRRSEGLSVRYEDDHTAVYDPEHGALLVGPEGRVVCRLNEVAAALWELCDGGTTTDEIARAVSEVSNLDPEAALADVRRTIESLRSLGAIEPLTTEGDLARP